MTAPRRLRSAWLLVGSTPGTLAKLHSAGQRFSRFLAKLRWRRLRAALRAASSSSARSSSWSAPRRSSRRARSASPRNSPQAANSRLVISSPAAPNCFWAPSPSLWAVKSRARWARAELARDFTAHSEGLGAQKQFGAAGLEITKRLFAAWGEFRGDADRARLLERLGALQEELRALLEEAARKAARNRRHRSFARNLLKGWPALWSFASVPGVEPTNNHAERSLRGAVIYRKLSLGSQSEEGERIVERLLSASVTCRLQGRSLFLYLTEVLTAKIRGDPIPLLT